MECLLNGVKATRSASPARPASSAARKFRSEAPPASGPEAPIVTRPRSQPPRSTSTASSCGRSLSASSFTAGRSSATPACSAPIASTRASPKTITPARAPSSARSRAASSGPMPPASPMASAVRGEGLSLGFMYTVYERLASRFKSLALCCGVPRNGGPDAGGGRPRRGLHRGGQGDAARSGGQPSPRSHHRGAAGARQPDRRGEPSGEPERVADPLPGGAADARRRGPRGRAPLARRRRAQAQPRRRPLHARGAGPSGVAGPRGSPASAPRTRRSRRWATSIAGCWGSTSAGTALPYFKLNQEFHTRLVGLSRNETLVEVQGGIQARLKRIRFIGNNEPSRWAEAVAEHEEMATAPRRPRRRRPGRGHEKAPSRTPGIG